MNIYLWYVAKTLYWDSVILFLKTSENALHPLLLLISERFYCHMFSWRYSNPFPKQHLIRYTKVHDSRLLPPTEDTSMLYWTLLPDISYNWEFDVWLVRGKHTDSRLSNLKRKAITLWHGYSNRQNQIPLISTYISRFTSISPMPPTSHRNLHAQNRSPFCSSLGPWKF